MKLPNEAGIIALSKARTTGALVAVYVACQQGIDVGCDKYAVVCQEHSSLVGMARLGDAIYWKAHPEEWCDACRLGAADNCEAARIERGW